MDNNVGHSSAQLFSTLCWRGFVALIFSFENSEGITIQFETGSILTRLQVLPFISYVTFECSYQCALLRYSSHSKHFRTGIQVFSQCSGISTNIWVAVCKCHRPHAFCTYTCPYHHTSTSVLNCQDCAIKLWFWVQEIHIQQVSVDLV